MSLEMKVARAVAWAHVLERAFHDPGPWRFHTDGGVTPAHRITDGEDSEIIFMGIIPPSRDGLVELWSGDEMITLFSIRPTQEEKRVTWRMSLRDSVPAS